MSILDLFHDKESDMKRMFAAAIKTLVTLGLAIGAVQASADIAVPARQEPGQQGLYKAAQMSKAGTALTQAFAQYRAHQNRGSNAPFVPANPFLLYSAGLVHVEARAAVDGPELLSDLRRLGLMNGSTYGELVSGALPLAALDRAVSLDSLRSISAAIPPVRNVGSVTSEGDRALRADVARTSYAVDGTGVTVGVLSDSFDTLGGAANDISSGDLPVSGVQVLSESTACGTLLFCIDEGRAMLQIIHDMAPGAELMFHTGLASKTEYASAITALAAAGADVIVDDLLYLNEPMFQDGIVAQAVDSVTSGGAVYYSAAGNAGLESYEGPFVDSGEILCIEFFLPLGDCDPIYERVGRMHDFDPGPAVDNYQHVTVPLNGVLTVAMQWNEPFGGAGPKTDHDVVLLDETGGIYYTISANDNIPMGEGWEVLQFQNSEFLYQNTSYSLAITYDDVDSVGPPAGLVKMVVFGAGNTINEHRTDSATLFGHANSTGARAVAAAFWQDTPVFGIDPPLREPYSSRGGTAIYFNPNGSAKQAPEVRAKPEITAVDGVGTTFFFSDTNGDGVDEFFGTSAAAPHAAGIAALMLDALPDSTPAELNSALESSAIDMESPGFDFDTGAGLIEADAAISALFAGAGNLPPTAGFTISTSGLTVDFTDTSTDADGSVSSWSWDFGDGTTATAQNTSHTYAVSGTYTATLTVTDNDGAEDAAGQLLTVVDAGGNASPVAAFSYECNARSCLFDSSGSSDDVDIVSWGWNFGDGFTSADENAAHTYASQGNYTVTLIVADAENETDSVSATFRVKNRGNTSGSVGGDGGTTETASEKGRKKCSDGIDNDGDGLIDGADPDC
jgi:PKD repeat protein